jgi:phosphatidylglycerol lysyltransferase
MKIGISYRASFIAVIVGLMGFLNIASSAVLIGRLDLLRQVMPSAITQGSRSMTLVAGFFLIAVAWNLAKRKRVAWRISIRLLALST